MYWMETFSSVPAVLVMVVLHTVQRAPPYSVRAQLMRTVATSALIARLLSTLPASFSNVSIVFTFLVSPNLFSR